MTFSIFWGDFVKYYFITYEETIGEFSHIGRTARMVADDISVDDLVKDYFGDFYGLVTTWSDGYWGDGEGARSVKLSSIREISKEDYEVLKRYL